MMPRISSILIWFCASVLVVVLGLIVWAWESDRPFDALAERWATPPSEFVPVNGITIHYRDHGPRTDQSPLLLLHGTSDSLHTWQGWVDDLAQTRRVITLDLPGFALTGPFADNDYSTDRYVETILDFMTVLELDSAIVGGNSFGGRLAWTMALLAPERVQALILVDASAYALDEEENDIPLAFRLAQTPGLNRLMENLLPRSLIEDGLVSVYGNPDLITEDLIDRYYELTLREGNRAAVVQRFVQSQPHDYADRIPDITQPTLILWGAEDRLIPRSVGDRLKRDITNSELVVFYGLGHLPHQEAPERTVELVQGFLTTLSE